MNYYGLLTSAAVHMIWRSLRAPDRFVSVLRMWKLSSSFRNALLHISAAVQPHSVAGICAATEMVKVLLCSRPVTTSIFVGRTLSAAMMRTTLPVAEGKRLNLNEIIRLSGVVRHVVDVRNIHDLGSSCILKLLISLIGSRNFGGKCLAPDLLSTVSNWRFSHTKPSQSQPWAAAVSTRRMCIGNGDVCRVHPGSIDIIVSRVWMCWLAC
mmetsp:Transcript_32125/g.83301  ORF Transcript_32125/g.83301 Transcript_32125/m.83301 type:complete len:210 (+) Transcript_32125:389-1018(+)